MSGKELPKYLYHYTSIESALSIVITRELRFSSIAQSNDVWEVKNRRVAASSETEFKPWEIFVLNQVLNQSVFSMSFVAGNEYPSTGKLSVTTTTPGYFIAPAWELYARGYSGLCLIFEGEALQRSSRVGSVGLWATVDRPITYDNQLVARPVEITRGYEIAQGAFNSHAIFDPWFETVNENHADLFFVKSKDWEYEREYRVIRYPKSADSFHGVERSYDRRSAPTIPLRESLKGVVAFGAAAGSPLLKAIRKLRQHEEENKTKKTDFFRIFHSIDGFSIDSMAPI